MITFQGKSEVARVLEALMPGQLEGTGIEPLSPATDASPLAAHLLSPTDDMALASSSTTLEFPPVARSRFTSSRAYEIGLQPGARCPADSQEGLDASWNSVEFGHRRRRRRRRRKGEHESKSEAKFAQPSSQATSESSSDFHPTARSTENSLSDSEATVQSRPKTQRQNARSLTGWQGLKTEMAALDLGERPERYEGPLDIPESHIAATQRLLNYQIDTSQFPKIPAFHTKPPAPTLAQKSVDLINSSTDVVIAGAATPVNSSRQSDPFPKAWSSWAVPSWASSTTAREPPYRPQVSTGSPERDKLSAFPSLSLTKASQSASATQAPKLEAVLGSFRRPDGIGTEADWDREWGFARSKGLGSASLSSGNMMSTGSTSWTGAPTLSLTGTSSHGLMSPLTDEPPSEDPKTLIVGSTDVLSDLATSYLSGRHRDNPRGTIRWDVISSPPPRESLDEFPFDSPSLLSSDCQLPSPSPEPSSGASSRTSYVVRTSNRPW